MLKPLVSIGLAWANGCIRSTPPEYLKSDCPAKDYVNRFEQRWTYGAAKFWQEAFQEYDERKLFKEVPKQLSGVTGRIVVHTQKASFVLDHTYDGSDFGIVFIRSNGRIAGIFNIEDSTEEISKGLNMNRSSVDCIALSVSLYSVDIQGYCVQYLRKARTLPVGEFFGCPCSLGGGVDSVYRSYNRVPKTHRFPPPMFFPLGLPISSLI